jgi:hypothetical protein
VLTGKDLCVNEVPPTEVVGKRTVGSSSIVRLYPRTICTFIAINVNKITVDVRGRAISTDNFIDDAVAIDVHSQFLKGSA